PAAKPPPPTRAPPPPNPLPGESDCTLNISIAGAKNKIARRMCLLLCVVLLVFVRRWSLRFHACHFHRRHVRHLDVVEKALGGLPRERVVVDLGEDVDGGHDTAVGQDAARFGRPLLAVAGPQRVAEAALALERPRAQ